MWFAAGWTDANPVWTFDLQRLRSNYCQVILLLVYRLLSWQNFFSGGFHMFGVKFVDKYLNMGMFY